MTGSATTLFKSLTIGLLIALGAANLARADEVLTRLRLITETANSICNIIPTKGSSSNIEIQGELKAQISALAKNLSTAGLSGSARLTESHYEGVLQQDLPPVLKENSQCKLKVFIVLETKLIGSERSASAPKPITKSDLPPNVSGIWTSSLGDHLGMALVQSDLQLSAAFSSVGYDHVLHGEWNGERRRFDIWIERFDKRTRCRTVLYGHLEAENPYTMVQSVLQTDGSCDLSSLYAEQRIWIRT